MTALTPSGYLLGVIEGTVIDTETSEIRFLLIKSQEAGGPTRKLDSRGRAPYAFDSLKISGRTVTVV